MPVSRIYQVLTEVRTQLTYQERSENEMQSVLSLPCLKYVNEVPTTFMIRQYRVKAIVPATLWSSYFVFLNMFNVQSLPLGQ